MKKYICPATIAVEVECSTMLATSPISTSEEAANPNSAVYTNRKEWDSENYSGNGIWDEEQ